MIKLDSIYTNNMVLQRDKEVVFTGTAEPNAYVNIYYGEDGYEGESYADENGRFRVVMPPHPYVEDPTFINVYMDVDEGDGEHRVGTTFIKNVVFGEVWLANGQSNMEFELCNSIQAEEAFERIKADSRLAKNIRFYNVIKAPYHSEEWDEKIEANKWVTMDENEAIHSSAVAFFAAVKLYDELNVPIGVVNCSKGGTSVSAWLDLDTLNESEDGKWYIKQYDELVGGKSDEEYFKELDEYNSRLDEYLIKKDAEEKKAGRKLSDGELNELIGPYPWPEPYGYKSPYRPGGISETMLKPVISMTYRGVWYYQGEEDADKNEHYKTQFIRYIKFIREKSGNPDLPFIYMQLPVWIDRSLDNETNTGWVEIRRIQGEVGAEVDNVHVIPLIDIGEYDNVHPVDKRTPGNRLGDYTLMEIYGVNDIDARPMTLAFAYSENGAIGLKFNNAQGGFMVNVADQGKEIKLVKYDGQKIKGFRIAGEDGVYYDADATVEGDNIILTSDKVPNPVHSSYGWLSYITCNLYNNAGMPLMPYQE